MLGWGAARAFILFHQWVNDRGMFGGYSTAALESRVRGGSRVQVGAGGGKQKEYDAFKQPEPTPLQCGNGSRLSIGNQLHTLSPGKADT